MKDILLIDKPKGITSFDVIRRLRKKLGGRKIGHAHSAGSGQGRARLKMGHAGTLDPNATGLLIIGIGKGTKKLSNFLKLPKTYEADILLGVKTETGDPEGKVIESEKVENIKEEKVKKVIEELEGKQELVIPKYSAVKIDGVPMYKLARAGKKVPRKTQEIEIFETTLLGHHPEGQHYLLRVCFEVSSGTYIRSLAEYIGKELGVPAMLQDLRRTRIGDFKVEDAEKI